MNLAGCDILEQKNRDVEIYFMCKLVELKIGNKSIKVADIKKYYIQNIVNCIKLCDAIDKVIYQAAYHLQQAADTIFILSLLKNEV